MKYVENRGNWSCLFLKQSQLTLINKSLSVFRLLVLSQ